MTEPDFNNSLEKKVEVKPLYGRPLSEPPRPNLVVLPGAVAAFVIGISACASPIIYVARGIPAIVLGITGIILARKSKELFAANPGVFKNGMLKLSKSGRTFSIVGLIIGGTLFSVYLLTRLVAQLNTNMGIH